MIGLFDSGVGGLTVLQEVRRALPDADLLYAADRARAPYGRRPLDEVRRFAGEITAYLLDQGAGMVVVACHTASAAALHHLRAVYPEVPFVGMEPALKPATGLTGSRVVGVLATAATFQGELFASVVDRHAGGVRVVTRACDGWVELVERGLVDGPEVEAAVRRHLEPVLAAGADTLVLGCTHYPLLAGAIRRLAGPGVGIVDPAPAVARQVARLAGPLAAGSGRLRLAATGPLDGLAELVHRLTGADTHPEPVTLPGE